MSSFYFPFTLFNPKLPFPQVQLLRQQLAELRRLLDEQLLEKADMEDQMRRLQAHLTF